MLVPPFLRPHLVATVIALTLFQLGWSAEVIDFQREVEPILKSRCQSCHGAEQTRSGLRLDQRTAMLRGGDFGEPAIIPGNATDSLLIQMVRGEDADLRMPPEGEPLSEKEIESLVRWIDAGAPWPGQMESVSPDDLATESAGHDHWAFQPVSTGSGKFAFQSIDAFIDDQLRERGLHRSPPADAATLLRRVTLILTGLPPTSEAIAEIESAPDGLDAAYQRAVDRLLDSPRYGERWAQHWLDVIRWAETVGFETNLERPNAWPYRDWVIQALNEDRPYNEFLSAQIAGDVSGEDAALGFLVSGPANLPGQIGRDEEAMRQARQDELDEVIGTVSQAFLGLTVGCARCHNHKFDPISQRDYYSMQAIFAGLQYGDRRLHGRQNDDWTAEIPVVREQLTRLQAERKSLQQQHGLKDPLADLHTDHFEPRTTTAVRMLIHATGDGRPASLYEFQIWTTEDSGDQAEASDDPTTSSNVALASAGGVPSASSFALENQTRHPDNLVDGSSDRRQAFPWVSASAGPAWLQVDLATARRIDRVTWDRGASVPAAYEIQVRDPSTQQWITVVETNDRMPRLDDTRAPDQVQLRNLSREQIETIVNKTKEIRDTQRELNRLSAGPQVFAASFRDSPEPTWLLHRGDPMRRREIVTPDIPSMLGELQLPAEHAEANRRVALAEHLTRPDHPLTSRVIVNRVWQHHFGAGLVETPSDFGTMGSRPSHPELLNWLAADFVQEGWSLKKLHRRIVLSETFRQASQPVDDALRIDAESRLLWRFPPRRLEAEAIRDSILAVSGKLNLKTGGPGFNLFQQRGGLSGFTPIETFDETGWRRMIYAHKIRMQAVDVFGAFDCPDAGQMKPKRTSSITPTQSLGLFNSPFILRQSRFFAERVIQEAGNEIPAQVDRAFEMALSRPPSTAEQSRMVELVETHGLPQLCRVLLNTSEFLWIQ